MPRPASRSSVAPSADNASPSRLAPAALEVPGPALTTCLELSPQAPPTAPATPGPQPCGQGPVTACASWGVGRRPLTQEALLLALAAEPVAAREEGVGVGLDVPRQAPQVQAQPDLRRRRHVRPAARRPLGAPRSGPRWRGRLHTLPAPGPARPAGPSGRVTQDAGQSLGLVLRSAASLAGPRRCGASRGHPGWQVLWSPPRSLRAAALAWGRGEGVHGPRARPPRWPLDMV